MGASTILLTYAVVVALAGRAIRGPGDLGLETGPCGEGVCVTWVMPAGHAWQDGARPGMRVMTLNGGDARSPASVRPFVEAELLSPKGRIFAVRTLRGSAARAWGRFPLWLTGGVFALLGAIVLVRRPDAPAARLFGLFAGFTGVALGVSPAASGPHPAWSLVVQFMSLLGLAASLPAFATAFVDGRGGSRILNCAFGLASVVVLAGYITSVLTRPSLYSIVRAGFTIYFVAGILAGLLVLARKALVRSAPPSVRAARLALSGIACGTLPFIGLTLIPQTAGHGSLVPGYITAVLWAIIPATFAYGILRHQVLGIRRLVHRGMIHGIAMVVLLGALSILVVAADSLVTGPAGVMRPAFVTAILLTLGVLLFHVIRPGIRSLVERFFHPTEVDSGTVLAGMRRDLLASECAEDVVAAMVKRLRDSLRLEAIVLFLGSTPETMRPAASAGSRADESIAFVRPRLLDVDLGERGLTERRWNSDVLLIAPLEAGSNTLGFLVLGPKEKGEVFLREERRLVETVTPILALAIRETTLLAELREVSERLTTAQEAERARLARDLHDGPLQKAILLGGSGASLRDWSGVARDLAAELRELCARLRPAILDDLGLVPALEWLLEQTAQGFTVAPRLTLRGMTEDDRLAPNAELALFRVTQEAVSNALKHGHATSIQVSLSRTKESVELSVIDDGNGFARTSEMGRGLGIPGMRERLRQVGGSIAVASNGSAGTMVTARIPYVIYGDQ